MAKAAVGQICSSHRITQNLEQCIKLVERAASAGAKVLFLPEASDYIASTRQESLSLAKPVDTSPFVAGLRSAAATYKLAVHVGIHVPVYVQPSPSPANPVLSSTPVPEPKTAAQAAQEAQAAAAAAASSSSSQETPAAGEVSAATPTQHLKLYNRTIFIRADGTLDPAGSYDKLHLFDYAEASLRESATTQAGSRFAPPFDSPVGRLGSLICFDLRFPEAALHLTTRGPPPPSTSPSPSFASPSASSPSSTRSAPSAPSSPSQPRSARGAQQQQQQKGGKETAGGEAGKKGGNWRPAQILLYPSAFTVPTGRAHWETLLRARAIETQSWVVAAAQVGRHNPRSSGRVSYGHSMVIDPWGRVVLELKGVRDRDGNENYDAEEGAVGELGIVDIDLDQWERVRAQMPLVRRTDVYPEV